MGVFVFLVADVPFEETFAQNTPVSKKASAYQFEVLSPWAEVDPQPVRTINARLDTLAGKKIGLFANIKRAAKPILAEVEKGMKKRFPDVQTSLFQTTQWNAQKADRPRFEAWLKGVDAAVVAVGD
jgi:hypothetical protein